ncbi:MAG: twin-arginine translocation pathway signal, partial [Bacteroidota bacterium]|nr:twin-arginine translocation pathway signal [Bacteroidota bacterium]
MLLKRKEFLQIGSLATASLMLPKFLKAFDGKAIVPPGNKVLVVLQFSGGNDGLNTVIPVRNDIYYKSRPKLGIEKNNTLALTDEVGINPALPAFKELFDDGSLGILNGVGYPNPDRSHFRSMDIWQSASDSDKYIYSGWLGRYLDAQCNGCSKPTQALEVDDVLSLALKGDDNKGLAVKDPRRLYNTSHEKYFKDINAAHENGEEPVVDYLYKTLSETLSSADYIFQQSKMHPSNQ